ncbi:MAG TPA: hypothetical protein VIV40_05060 [Kofleriaceae bacterium]
MGSPSDIDRLIELGLNRYGAGDLDGALLMWEEALAIDPDNTRASSYVDYVRHNYELLSGEPELAPGDEAPFGIEEEPEYLIQLDDAQLVRRESQPVLANTQLDAGWFDEEATHDVSAVVGPSADAPAEPEPAADGTSDDEYELELQLDPEPPPVLPPPDINFDDATREYYGSPTKPSPPVATPAPAVPIAHNEFESGGTASDYSETAGTSEFQQDQYTGGFSSEGTPVGFSNQETEIRKRDFGFVQPTAAAPVPVTDKPSSPLSIGTAPTIDTLSFGELQERLATLEGTSPGEKTTERKPTFSLPDDAPDENDLLAGLPVPKQPAQEIETQDIPVVASNALTKELPGNSRLPGTKAVTKDMPQAPRPPARRDSAELSQAEVMMRAAPTQDFTPEKIDIGAPTRELGLRPQSPRAGSLPNPVDEDAPTKQSDVRAIRETAREQGRAQSVTEETHSDIRLPEMDPLDAKAAQILDEVDTDAPAEEAHDEQTRRRIGSLLEHAVTWSQAGDTQKAVLAVDLALNEDPNSALGQKLITRNRETIMTLFQSYLGSLDRQPQLAKPLHELQNAPISPRAAFLLSRIDGTLTIDELLDVSGMPRLEAYRHLCQLYLRGILR